MTENYDWFNDGKRWFYRPKKSRAAKIGVAKQWLTSKIGVAKHMWLASSIDAEIEWKNEIAAEATYEAAYAETVHAAKTAYETAIRTEAKAEAEAIKAYTETVHAAEIIYEAAVQATYEATANRIARK